VREVITTRGLEVVVRTKDPELHALLSQYPEYWHLLLAHLRQAVVECQRKVGEKE
jgi:hypothetical protein